jgi:two-component system, OmpR family, phosphate regulon sensor histidine kinase PhoR
MKEPSGSERAAGTEEPSSSSAGKDGNRDASSIIAEAAHELRLPIANIKLLVETLLDGALDDREVCKRMLKRVYQESDRLQSLVSDLLSLESVEKRHELKCRWISLKERASYAVEALEKRATEKGVQVKVEADERSFVWVNAEQFDQVLLNLVENAIKFTPSGGSVIVRSLTNTGRFSVEDTGVGMAQSEIPKIFSRFYRIDKGRAGGGTGLGLSIVKQVLDLHGAKITVRSQEGAGSTFELDFPTPLRGVSVR